MKQSFCIKLAVALVAVALSINGLQAQMHWQARVGMGISDLMGSNRMNTRFAYRFGVEVDIPIGSQGWGVQPGLYYAHKGAEFLGIYEKNHTYVGIFDNRMNYAELPVYAIYRWNMWQDWSLKFKAGGYVAYGLNGSAHVNVPGTEYQNLNVVGDLFKDGCDYGLAGGQLGSDKADYFYSPPYKRIDAGAAAGIDLQWRQFIVGIDAQYGFAPVVDRLYLFGFFQDPTLRNFTAHVSVGYQF